VSPGVLPEPPETAAGLFGDRFPLVRRYAAALATAGVERGLIGPREVDRLWERHLLNCAVLTERIGPAATLIDVGSGAGLPGIVLALARPDLSVTVLDPLARRVAFLTEVVSDLGLTGVVVMRGRAEDPDVRRQLPPADVVTARAVASLDTLAGWCLPLLRVGGRLIAMKGASAVEEAHRSRPDVQRYGGTTIEVVQCGAAILAMPTTVVEVTAGVRARRSPAPAGSSAQKRSRR
jgi:16S rRNA (guanine527-N7)-methyltransferase